MKTPEQVGGEILAKLDRDLTAKYGDGWMDAFSIDELGPYLAEAAREAHREARMNTVDVLLTIKKATEPQFAPEGVPDAYRDAWERIECQFDYLADLFHVTLGSRVDHPGGDGGSMTAPKIYIEGHQARHILAYLSEQSREDDE